MNDKFNAFYSAELHLALMTKCYPDNMDITRGGVYLVMFRVLRTKKGIVLIYSYMYYPEIFVNSLLRFLFIRNEFYTQTMLYQTWGEFLCLIEDILFGSEKEIETAKGANIKCNKYYIDYITNSYNEEKESRFSNDGYSKSLTTIFYRLKKLVLIKDMSFLLDFIDLAVKKDYYPLCKLLLHKSVTSGLNFYDGETFDNNEQYLIRDSLFVVRDMNLFLNLLTKNKNLEINKGTKTERAQPISMLAFLSCLDASYRLNLYNYYNDLRNKGYIGGSPLHRRDFSFRRIHQNISNNIKWYSTTSISYNNKKNISNGYLLHCNIVKRYLSSSICLQNIKSKQELFNDNCSLITNILKENCHIGSKDLQRKIEIELKNQDVSTLDINHSDDNKSYEIINYKCKIEDTINKNFEGKSPIIPVVAYTNVENQRRTILDNNINKSGVYRWVNIKTGEFYIGSSINLSRKLLYYFNSTYMTKYKSKSIIYSTLLKYGYKIFTLHIIEYCDTKNTLEREQYYIDRLKPKYNILKFAASSLGFRHSESTKLQMSIKNTKEKHPFFGKKHTEESKRKMSLSKTVLAVEIKDLKTGVVKTFNSNVQAAKYLNVSEWTVRKYKKDKKLYKSNYLISTSKNS